MKILVTGGSGMLAADVIPTLSKAYNIIAPPKNELDVTSAEAVMNALSAEQYDWVIHMAAFTDLDWCEDHELEANEVNSRGTENVARACSMMGGRMVYISTSGIFSGKLGRPYTEDDVPKPANVYGLSKYNGELAVQKWLSAERRLILRVGWLFGGGEHDKKFVGKIFRLMKSVPQIRAVADVWGSPNYSVDIGRLMLEMITKQITGLFHVANSGEPASRYDIAMAVIGAAGLSVEIEAVPASQFPTRAVRPPLEAITSVKLRDAVGYNLRHWRDALSEYVHRLSGT